jgi:uncharacterized protein (TIGR03083 family)
MNRMHGSKEMWLGAMQTDGPALRAAALAAGPTVAVPSRSEWTVADLLHHLCGMYRWVHSHVVRGVTDQPDRPLSAFLEEPRVEDILAWWDEQYAAIMSTLDVLDPDMPAWNWAPQTKRASFWHRRLAHETAVARWDAQMATGLAEPLESKLAADGVSEALDTFLPAGHRFGPATANGLVALHATDIDHTWHVRLRGEGIALLDTETIFDDDDLRARALAIGSASDLMLALHGRVDVDVLDITGDVGLIEAVRVS